MKKLLLITTMLFGVAQAESLTQWANRENGIRAAKAVGSAALLAYVCTKATPIQMGKVVAPYWGGLAMLQLCNVVFEKQLPSKDQIIDSLAWMSVTTAVCVALRK